MTSTDINGRLWSLKDVSSYLQVAEKTVTRMIQRGEIPAVRVGNQWRVIPTQLHQWLQAGSSQPESVRDLLRHDPTAVPIDRILKPERITVHVTVSNRAHLFHELAQAVSRVYPGIDSEAYTRSLERRENLVPTSLGGGLAVPHVRDTRENPTGSLDLFVLTTEEPIPFGPDSCSVFCLTCTDDLVLHLRLMQKVSYVMRAPGTVAQVQQQTSAHGVMSTIMLQERNTNHEKR
ncbi:MAG TPA: PTS sugar transporter subunit IIA [Alkalispirochaeta sp.]|nr:PTS sugar transporter subunit IIA [Alkalispirochaeta sp.]